MMRVRNAIVVALCGLVLTVGWQLSQSRVLAQGPSPAQGDGAQAPPARGEGRGGRGGGGGAEGAGQSFRLTFPAAQRAPGDPELIARGKALYDVSCRLCHGADLRGGDMGGVNLVRSELVLNDQKGELMLPIIQKGRSRPGMPPMPAVGMSEENVVAVAEFIHSMLASGRGGGPAVPLDLLVGDVAAGQAYFTANCSACHSVSGDLAKIGARIPDIMVLQNTWVAGMRIAGGREAPLPKPSTVTVTVPKGSPVTGELVRMDDFIVVLRLPDGTERSFRRQGDLPEIYAKDPREPHIKLWTTLQDKDMHDVTAYLASIK